MDGAIEMKPFTSTESSALVAGMLLVVLGLVLIVWPRQFVVQHATNNYEGTPTGVVAETVSRTGSRVCGVISLIVGGVFMTAGLYGRAAKK